MAKRCHFPSAIGCRPQCGPGLPGAETQRQEYPTHMLILDREGTIRYVKQGMPKDSDILDAIREMGS